MKLTGYDADEGRRYYVDTKDGSTWVGAPYVEYGILKPLRSRTTARQNDAKYGRKVHSSTSESSVSGRPVRRRSTRDTRVLDRLDKALPSTRSSPPAPDDRDPEKAAVEDGKDVWSTRATSTAPIVPSESSGSVYSQSSYPHDGQTTPTATMRQRASAPRTTSPAPITPTTSSASMYSQSSYPRDGNATPTATEKPGAGVGRSQTFELWKAWDTHAGASGGSSDQEGKDGTRTESAPNLANPIQDGNDLASSSKYSKQDLPDSASSTAVKPLLSQNESADTNRKRKHPAFRQISRLIARVL
ncbi:unnamed protein product [Cyclocybe aegerita]|uniref:Uncharacterized protein n=1 Tax=Cyclocybe aegerita TaxID=1973307 RepID=A0A8S0W4H8_CYCAE|nr:unnamed protein product [Cyclocybe aegerita]